MSHLRSAGGEGENHQLPAALGWGSAEKGLSLSVPLSFLSVFLKSLDAVTNLNSSSQRNALNSAIFCIADHQVQPHVCWLQL